jgi:hypothetical protein
MGIGFAVRCRGSRGGSGDTAKTEREDVRSVKNGGVNDLNIGDLPCGELRYWRAPGPCVRNRWYGVSDVASLKIS